MTNPRRTTSAFTLLELLIVLGILAILIGLLVAAGVAVTRNSKLNQTRGVVQALDRALEEFIIANNGNVPRFIREGYVCTPGHDGPNGSNPMDYLTTNADQMPQRPDASVFLRQARGVGDVDTIIGSIPERFLIVTAIPTNQSTGNPACDANLHDTAPSIVDSWFTEDWRRPTADEFQSAWPVREQSLIYYVHPNNRRNRSNSMLDQYPDAQELYGETQGGRPYFLSAGPDGFYGHPGEFDEIIAYFGMAQLSGESPQEFANRVLRRAREDNVYSAPIDIDFTIRDGVLDAFDIP